MLWYERAGFHRISLWKMEYWDLTQSEGYITKYTPLGVYGPIVYENNEGINSLMIV